MWRLLNGIRRAIRQHICSRPTSATGAVTLEEEVEHGQENLNKEGARRQYNYRESSDRDGCGCGNGGPNHDWWRCHTYNFWTFLRQTHSLETIGCGTIVILGIKLSKHPWTFKNNEDAAQSKCLFHRAIQVLPTTDFFPSYHSILGRDVETHLTPKEDFTDNVDEDISDTEDVNHNAFLLCDNQCDQEGEEECGKRRDSNETASLEDPIAQLFSDFENTCRKYTAVARTVEGLLAVREGHMTKAVETWTMGSDLGYSKSQFNLGLCYETGQGVEKDLKKAFHYYKEAASEGHPQALYNLALMYLEGHGVSRKPEKAIQLLEKAATAGLSQAQTYLGVHYVTSENPDLETAASLFQEAAKQDDPEAQYFLGICYERGFGVEVNECKAASLYSQGASGGHDGAMYNLAMFHEHGLGGLPEDKLTARDLCQKAADLGNEHALQYLHHTESDDNAVQCLMDSNFSEIDLLTKRESENTEEKPTMSSSSSSPSLTDFIRKHLHDLQIGSNPLSMLYGSDNQTFLSTQILQSHMEWGMKLPVSIQVAHSASLWEPQYGSPKFSVPASPDNCRVSFNIGADEDDLDHLSFIDSDLDLPYVSEEEDNSISITRILKTSTMPNLNYVS